MANPILQLNHIFLQQIVQPGDTVIDATAGNGQDTLFLARLVAPRGMVHALDIQAEALEATKELVRSHSLEKYVTVHLMNHAGMAEVTEIAPRAVVFNLGYLPGGDKGIITETANTVHALSVAASMLSEGGVLSVVTYSGHAGGSEEEDAVANWCRSLNRCWTVVSAGLENKGGNPPRLWLARKDCTAIVDHS